MIKVSHLTKTFGTLKAVDKLSLTVKKGEIYGFLGPNGAGKTTTIKILTGVLLPSEGQTTISGFDIVNQSISAKKIIGYIPDDPYVYPELSGREFLYFTGELFLVKNLKQKIDRLLKIYHLEKIVDAPFKNYSRGNKQKLVILAAFLHQPQVLIIDEPILGLDPLSSQITINLFKKFAQKGGTIFVSSHTLSTIEKICHRVGIIDQGKLIFEGTLKDLQKKVKDQSSHLESLFLKLTTGPQNN
ncbi:ABC transporter ATP-binding protein [Patescibacteria group bacterium]